MVKGGVGEKGIEQRCGRGGRAVVSWGSAVEFGLMGVQSFCLLSQDFFTFPLFGGYTTLY